MRITRMMTALCVLLTLSAISFAGVPKTVSYQGRLTAAGGAPVPNGTYSVRFSLWSDPTLGTESWSETQMVTVTDGLFSTELGSISPFYGIYCPSTCDEWLQIEVTIGGSVVAMSPRTHLSASPWSLVSRSLYSEEVSGLARARGIVGKKPAGGGTGMRMLLDADSDGDGHADYSIEDSVTTESASRVIGHDLDSDGLQDVVVASAVDATGASFQVGDNPSSSQFGTLIESMVNIVEDRAFLGLRSLNGLPPGTPVEDNISLETNGDSASVTLRSLNGLPPGTPWEDNIKLVTTSTSSSIGINEVLPYVKLHVSKSGSPVVSNTMAADIDLDGVEDRTVNFTCDNSSSRYLMRAGIPLRSSSSSMFASPDSASSVMESDSDGDGVAEARRLVLVSGSTGSTSKLSLQRYGGGILIHDASTEVNAVASRNILKSYFENGDKPTQEQIVNSSGSSFRAINTKGTGSTFRSITEATDSALSVLESDSDGDGNAEVSAAVSSVGNLGGGGGGGSSAAAYARMSADSDDDGVADNTAEMIVTPTTSSMAIKTKGTGAQRISVGGDCDDSDASLYATRDADGDGNAESRANIAAVINGNVVIGGATDPNDDGNDDNSAEMVITPTKSSLAIKTKGTSAQRFSAGGDCDDNDASLHTGYDSDNDGIMESSISQVSDSGGTNQLMTVRLGATPARISTNMTIEKQTQKASFGEKCDLDGDGVTDMSAEIVTDADGAGIAMDYHGIQARLSARPGWDGTIKGHLRLDNGPDMNVLFESDGDGYVATRFGIGVLEPSHPLAHSSGAHLTIGGTWTNASDENLKENFEKVDGSEILEKIEELPVSEWNYRTEGDEIKHIGPTAQDFKAAFGLGDNDKSVSTIDPSGVALVAIKELAKQNKDLKKKNADLEEKLNELQKQIEKLASAIKK